MSDIITAIRSKKLFGALQPFRRLDSWANWLVALKAAFALPMTDADLEVYRRFTGRKTPPEQAFRELWFIVGRRGGKSFMAALMAVYLAVFVKWPLGLEKGYIMIIAVDRRQAGVVFNYVRRILELSAFKKMVVKEGAEELELSNRVVIAVQTCSFKSLRGYQVLACVADEISMWSTEFSTSNANPAQEILTALRPSLGSMKDSRLISISTGFQRSGPMFETYRDKYGVDDPEVLVWAASTTDMNPLYSRKVIDRALKEDYQAAAVEYGEGVFFRADLEGFLSTEALEGVIVPGRLELAPQRGVDYVAGVDTSGGRGDAAVLNIMHRAADKVIQDCIRAAFPPFDPAECVKRQFAPVVKEYGIREVVGDKYAASFHSGVWEAEGIRYKNADLAKSDYYLEFLPLVMRRGVELLDHKRQTTEFRQLLRRTGKQRDTVDHAPNGHDDHSNCCALAVVEASRSEGAGAAFGTIEHDVYPHMDAPDDEGFGGDSVTRAHEKAFAEEIKRARQPYQEALRRARGGR